MTVQLALCQLEIPEGQRLRLHGLSWQEFEAILGELGEHRASRIAYFDGILEVRMPLPEHEVDKELIGDIVFVAIAINRGRNAAMRACRQWLSEE